MAPVMTSLSTYANQQLDDALASEKMVGGPKLIVKNTFFDVDEDVPAAEPLQRSCTAPPCKWSESIESDSDAEDNCPVLMTCQGEQCKTIIATVDPLCSLMMERESSNMALSPPSPSVLTRVNTYNEFEEPINTAFVGVPNHQGPRDNLFGHCPRFLVPGTYPSEFQEQVMSSQLPDRVPHIGQMASMAEDVLASGSEWEVLVEATRFHPQTLRQWKNRITGVTTTAWTVDARKLRSNDRLTVSPLFFLWDGHPTADPLPCKMIINGKDGSFRKAQGRCTVQLKCEAPREEEESYPITFCLSAGNGHQDNSPQQPPRGPVTCNFAQSGLGGLPKDNETWCFLDTVDEKSQTFVVYLDALPPQSHSRM